MLYQNKLFQSAENEALVHRFLSLLVYCAQRNTKQQSASSKEFVDIGIQQDQDEAASCKQNYVLYMAPILTELGAMHPFSVPYDTV